MTTPAALRFTLDRPPFAARTGLGVRIAVLDSGIHPGNPHTGQQVQNGVHITRHGETGDSIDRIGHGTAVAAAILEKAPAAELVPVRIFDHSLATSADVLARAIRWAADRECRLINLSLGTVNSAHEHLMNDAVTHATACGALVVSACVIDGQPAFPGSLDDTIGVAQHPDCPRDEMHVTRADGRILFHASEFPRPVHGIPQERNLRGISFAVANTTGFLARFIEKRPELRSAHELQHAIALAARTIP